MPGIKNTEPQFADPLEKALVDFANHLEATLLYDEEEGYNYWPDVPDGENAAGNSYNGAKLFVDKFGGKVVGYYIASNENQELSGATPGGIDFAVIGDYLVDFWGYGYEQSIPRPVLHRERDRALIEARYKPETEWEVGYEPKIETSHRG